MPRKTQALGEAAGDLSVGYDETYDDENPAAKADGGDLDDLDDPEYPELKWSIFRILTPEQMAARGQREPRVWVGSHIGPISLSDVQSRFGGGKFEFFGKQGRLLRRKAMRFIEGDPIIVKTPLQTADVSRGTLVPVVGVNGVENGSPRVGTSDAIAQHQIRRLKQRLRTERAEREREANARAESDREERLQQQLRESEERTTRLLESVNARLATPPPAAAPAPPPPLGIMEMLALIKAAKDIGGGGGDATTLAKMGLDFFRQGITIGEGRDPKTDDDAGGTPAWVEPAIQVLNTLLARGGRPPMPSRPPGAAPAGAAPPPAGSPAPSATHPVSEAVVVTEPTQGATPEHRWHTAVESVYRGMLEGKDPGNIAASLEDMLNAAEYGMLRGGPEGGPSADQIITHLPIMAQFPQLATEQGKVYLTAVLTAMRTEDDEDETSGA